jgi:hypothetical protein
MSPVHKAQALREAIESLLDAKALVFVALGDSDAGKETRDCIQELVDDLRADVLELTN